MWRYIMSSSTQKIRMIYYDVGEVCVISEYNRRRINDYGVRTRADSSFKRDYRLQARVSVAHVHQTK